ncbi:hypothetical protein BDV26DRAFT_256870 [Aspergillus bertholletiae]|uniref:Uncharacterized protein n=1 Tax=Aspergillus bertholletiae TaxID=1226010 RepID=A0A5N7BG27_9EURO|nr:hypothetical protein BDV26DRAFT_256870 [Aspergillus bertholletiae]
MATKEGMCKLILLKPEPVAVVPPVKSRLGERVTLQGDTSKLEIVVSRRPGTYHYILPLIDPQVSTKLL